ADGVVLDVKVGEGAFMTNLDDAKQLARLMVDIGTDAGRDMVAVISDMNQPLGSAVGNALEVAEAIETLRGGGPADFRAHCLEVAAHMLRLAGQGKTWTDLDEARDLLAQHLDNGLALAKFRLLVEAQGGDVQMVDDPSRLPQARLIEQIHAGQGGYIKQVSALRIAQAAFELGAGREKKGDPIDLAVGVQVHVNVGDLIHEGDAIATIHANDEARLERSRALIEQVISYSPTPVDPLPLFYDVIEGR